MLPALKVKLLLKSTLHERFGKRTRELVWEEIYIRVTCHAPVVPHKAVAEFHK
jgi:hypothetical protein